MYLLFYLKYSILMCGFYLMKEYVRSQPEGRLFFYAGVAFVICGGMWVDY